MSTVNTLPTTKVTKSYGLRPSYVLAVKVLAKRRRHEIESEVIRDLIDRQMRFEQRCDDWENDIALVAAQEGVTMAVQP